MDDKTWDVLLVVISTICGKALDIAVERLKEKTPKRQAKHFKRS